MKSFLGRSLGWSRWWLAVAAAVAVALVVVGVALGVHFAGSGSGASESSGAAPTASPAPEATQVVSPTASPVVSPSLSPTGSPAATTPVSPTPTSVDRPPTPYPPMDEGILGGPSCPEGWLPYDSPPNDFAFCAPQGWDVIVGSSIGRIINIWNPALSARIAESGSKGGGDIFPGEVFVQMDNMMKTANKEKWALSCDQFKLTVSGKEASGCVQYGDPIMGAPEDVVSVVVWIDRGETILVVSGRFWTSETADVDRETILQMGRSIQLR